MPPIITGKAPSRGRSHVKHPVVNVAPPSGDLRIGPSLSESDLRLSVIVPTFNEAHNVEVLVDALAEQLQQILADAFEIIVVDDDSPDRTWEKATELAAIRPYLRVMRRLDERSPSTAVIRGWQVARGDTLAVIDADLQHPPEVISALWGRIVEGADLAIGSRHVPGGGVSDWSWRRRVVSRGAQLIGLLILPEVIVRVTDPMSGYFMIRRHIIEGTYLNPVGYKILLEILARCDIRQLSEVGYVFRERQNGQSKVSGRVYFQYLNHLLRLRLVGFRHRG